MIDQEAEDLESLPRGKIAISFAIIREGRFLTASETAQRTIGRHQAPISSDTVRRRLRARDMRNCQSLTRRHRLARLQW